MTDLTTETTMTSTVSAYRYTNLPTGTTIVQNGTGQALCLCLCSENGTIPPPTRALYGSLKIDKKGLSSYRNSRICIADNRPSAVALGSLGVGIIVLFALLIVLPDAVRLLRFIVNKCWVFIYFLALWLCTCVWKLDEPSLYKKSVNFEFINNCMLP